MIEKIEGAVSAKDVPTGLLTGTTSVETYAAFTATNDAFMKTGLPDPIKVLLTILRKLFMQRGAGRQNSALRRGLPAGMVRYVDPIIAQVKAKGFAEDVYLDRRTILIPNRSRSAEALGIINGPNTSQHPLIGSADSVAKSLGKGCCLTEAAQSPAVEIRWEVVAQGVRRTAAGHVIRCI